MNYKSNHLYMNQHQGHKDAIYHVLPFGKNLVATASADKTIIIWKNTVKSTKCVKILRGHKDEVNVLEKISDNHLLSGGANGELRVWNFESGTSTLLSNDKNKSYVDPNLSFWSKCINKMVSSIYVNNPQTLIILCKIPDNRAACVFGNRMIEIWDTSKYQQLKSWKLANGTHYLASTELGHLLSADDEGCSLWNLENYELIAEYKMNIPNLVINTALLLPNNEIVFAGYMNEDRVLFFVDVGSHNIKREYILSTRIRKISMLTDDLLFFSGNQTCSIWSLRDNIVINQFKLENYITALSEAEIAIYSRPSYQLTKLFEKSFFTIARFPSAKLNSRQTEEIGKIPNILDHVNF